MTRHFFFRQYWWVALLVGGVLAGVAWCVGGDDRIALVGAVIAGVLGFCYFVQQQKLAETALFHQLFTAFNARYDTMNDRLVAIADKAGQATVEERALIIDYFNLCAEEYLFFKEGYIHRDAWRAWCRGMHWYLRRHPFRDIWHEEIKTESFYGLTLERILEGTK